MDVRKRIRNLFCKCIWYDGFEKEDYLQIVILNLHLNFLMKQQLFI